jgi:hypothetical protein
VITGGNALIAQFTLIYGFGKWAKNRLSGEVLVTLVAAAKCPRCRLYRQVALKWVFPRDHLDLATGFYGELPKNPAVSTGRCNTI